MREESSIRSEQSYDIGMASTRRQSSARLGSSNGVWSRTTKSASFSTLSASCISTEPPAKVFLSDYEVNVSLQTTYDSISAESV